MDIYAVSRQYDFNRQDVRNRVAVLYLKKKKDYGFIAYERNKILEYVHGKIPSYALWDESSVQQETENERFKWFQIHMNQIVNMYQRKFFSEISQRFIGPSSSEN